VIRKSQNQEPDSKYEVDSVEKMGFLWLEKKIFAGKKTRISWMRFLKIYRKNNCRFQMDKRTQQSQTKK